jgi:hypothetical protein
MNAIGFAIRTAVNENTGYTPAALMLLRELQHPAVDNRQEQKVNHNEYVQKMQQTMSETRNNSIENIAASKERRVNQFNAGRTEHNFQVGNLVRRRTHILSSAEKGVAASMQHKYDGPFRISRILGKNSCILETLDGKTAGKRHAEDLELFVGQPEWAQ